MSDPVEEAIRAFRDALLRWAEACGVAFDALAQALKPMFEQLGKLDAAFAEATPYRPPRPTAPRLLRLAAQSAWRWHWDPRYGRR